MYVFINTYILYAEIGSSCDEVLKAVLFTNYFDVDALEWYDDFESV